jgi:hypothetical protein
VLARLDATPGVVRSEVDASGKRFRVLAAPDADASAIVAAARRVLGGSAREIGLDAAPEEEPIAGLAGRWFGAGDALALTRIEARLYRLRIVMSAIREGVIRSPRDAKVLGDAAGAELNEALRAAEQGGHLRGDWLTAAWPALWSAVVDRCRSRIGADELAKLAHWFETSGGPGYVMDRGSAQFLDSGSAEVKSARERGTEPPDPGNR